MFSIIIPTLNEEKFLPNLLASLASQTRKNFEVIIVDGCSTDETVRVAKSFQQKFSRFKILEGVARGVSHQRNEGARVASGEWLIFVDADSVLLPYALERFSWFINAYHPQHFTSWVKPDSEKGDEVIVSILANFLIEGAQLLKRPFAVGALTAVTRPLFAAIGGFDESITWGEDYDLTLRIYKRKIPLYIIRETLYIFSMRRYRTQGTFRWFQTIAKAIVSVLVTKKAPRDMPGYIMGGHVYTVKRTPIQRSVIKQFNAGVRKLMKELFEL